MAKEIEGHNIRSHKVSHILRLVLIFIILAFISFLGGVFASIEINKLTEPSSIVPKVYQGYYLTQVVTHTNEYDHIVHITPNAIESSNSTNQLQNAGSYDSNPDDIKYSHIRFKFNVKHVHFIKHKGASFIGNVSKQTTPVSHFNEIKKYHRLPPLVAIDHRLIFTSLEPKGIVKAVKLKQGSITVNNLKISSHLANVIKNENSNNESAFHNNEGDN